MPVTDWTWYGGEGLLAKRVYDEHRYWRDLGVCDIAWYIRTGVENAAKLLSGSRNPPGQWSGRWSGGRGFINYSYPIPEDLWRFYYIDPWRRQDLDISEFPSVRRVRAAWAQKKKDDELWGPQRKRSY
jgi:hypothetical protein